jgi:hypothetical protein
MLSPNSTRALQGFALAAPPVRDAALFRSVATPLKR